MIHENSVDGKFWVLGSLRFPPTVLVSRPHTSLACMCVKDVVSRLPPVLWVRLPWCWKNNLNLCTPREVFKICCSCSTVFSLCVVHEQCFILSWKIWTPQKNVVSSYEQMFLTALKTYIWTPQHLLSTSSAGLWEKCTVWKSSHFFREKKIVYTHTVFPLIIKGKNFGRGKWYSFAIPCFEGKNCAPTQNGPYICIKGKNHVNKNCVHGILSLRSSKFIKGRGSNLTVLHGGQCRSISTQLQALKDVHAHPSISKVDAVLVADKTAGQLETFQSMSNTPPCKCDQRS